MKLLSITLPYLLLVTFYTGPLKDFGPEKISAINDSPFQGVAVPLIRAYDTGEYAPEDFGASLKRLKESTEKNIWPWVFFNRFIGHKEGGRSHSNAVNQSYFNSINAMDLYNEAGALGDFYGIWKISLEIAKELGSPGIIVDPEAYNNYDTYKVSYISSETGIPKQEVKRRLLEIGLELARIAEETYPGATVWFLYTGLHNPMRSLNPFADEEYRSVTYIIQGMLEYAKENDSKLKFVSGGERSPGYCNVSLENLKNKIRSRRTNFKESLHSFPNLRLGGTIAPWDKTDLKTGWMSKGQCGRSDLKTISDFKPMIKYLMKSYDYVWIYAAKAAGYDPYDRNVYPTYNHAIGSVLIERSRIN